MGLDEWTLTIAPGESVAPEVDALPMERRLVKLLKLAKLLGLTCASVTADLDAQRQQHESDCKAACTQCAAGSPVKRGFRGGIPQWTHGYNSETHCCMATALRERYHQQRRAARHHDSNGEGTLCSTTGSRSD